MIYGLGAALGWGLADFLVAIVARRIGSFATVVLAQFTGCEFRVIECYSPDGAACFGRFQLDISHDCFKES